MPIHYDILIDTVLEKNDFKYSGTVTIKIEVIEVTDIIELYVGPELTVSSTELRLFGDLHNTEEITAVLAEERGMWIITCAKLLEKGSIYTITMEFASKLSNENVGFYTTSYKNTVDGKLKWIAATNFKPVFARNCFPCYDEPDMKATFQLSLKYPDNMISTVMGTKVAYHSCGADKQIITTFETTAKIPPYQFGFSITDLPKMNTDTSHGITISSFYRRIANRFLQTAVKFAPQIFDLTYRRFNGDKSFPTPKGSEIILCIMPYNDTKNTPHWNLIFYREQDLYYNSALHNIERFNNMLVLIGINMIHQWFSYVTPEWWHDFWISEGISVYLAWTNSRDLFPKNGVIEQFQIDVLHSAFRTDSEPSALASDKSLINFFLVSDDIFDAYTFYREKSPCIIRMMRHSLGDKVFYDAMENILTNKQYENVDRKYFFKMFDEALVTNQNSNFNTYNTYESWFILNGYPLVTVTVKDKEINLTQRHFQIDGGFNEKNMWNIPINYIIPKKKPDTVYDYKPRFWLNTAQLTQGITEKGFSSKIHWLILNIEQKFYYRVNYDENNWKLIIAALNKKHTDFSALIRGQLIDDAFAVAKAGYLKYEILEKIIDYMKNERDAHPLKVFRRAVNDFQKGPTKTQYKAAFKKLAKKIDSIQLYFKQNNVKND